MNTVQRHYTAQLFLTKLSAMTYFLSSWTLNLGVVPLLRFFAFRFAPPFFAFLDLLFSVIHVLETIFTLLIIEIYKVITPKIKKLEFLYLQRGRFFVKAILYGSLISIPSFLFITSASSAWAMKSPQEAKETPLNNIILSIGEHEELSLPNLKQFSIGNADIVAHKFYAPSKKLLLKAKKLGHTELLVWTLKNEKLRYHIYIFSKQKQLKLAEMIQSLQEIGLSVKTQGAIIQVSGELQSIEDYLFYKKIEEQCKDDFFSKVTLKKEARNELVGTIYQALLKENSQRISCTEERASIQCQYAKETAPTQELLTYFSQKYFIKFLPISGKNTHKNYRARLKIIQMERLDGEELSFGLYRLSGTLDEVFTGGVKQLINKNEILLQQDKVDLSTLAEPETILQLDHPAKLQLGQEIPFNTGSGHKQNVQWKFAGLQVELKLLQEGDEFKIEYNTEFTNPSEGNISGSKNSSILSLKFGKATPIFQIGFKTVGESSTGIPLLNEIPVLGSLFKSKSKQSTYKNITGIIVVEEFSNE